MMRDWCFGRITAVVATLALALTLWGSPLDDAVLPIRVASGTTATLDRASPSGREVFGLQAAAGQTLLLELNACCAKCAKTDDDKADDVRVVLADAKQPESVSSRLSHDSLPWYWMNVLPSSGNYHIVVNRPSKKRYNLRVTLMDADDPRLTPSISADRVSISAGLLPQGKTLALKAFEPQSFCEIDDRLPAHLSAEGMGFDLQIMSLEGLKKAWWGDPEGLAHIARLELALRQGTKPSKPPLLAFQDAALTYWGGIELIEGKSWRGLRWIAAYAQDRSSLENPLQYMLEAITNDGRYFILIHVDIEYLNRPRELSQLSSAQVKQLDNPKVFQAFEQKVRAALNGALPEFFKPNLGNLDGAARSVELH
jgi:hypothetical protein